MITCQVTGARRYSSDLAQGSLEVPRTYTFVGTSKEIAEVRKLLVSSPTTRLLEPSCKKIKIEDSDSQSFAVWLKFGGQCLTELDIEGRLLNDRPPHQLCTASSA